MVKSKLNAEINYIEDKSINDEDVGHQSSIYIVNLFDMDIAIVLGKPKYSFTSKKIVYYPIYIISGDKIKSQIGLYEIHADKTLQVIDEDGDIDIDKLDEPLFYSFVNKKYIQKAESNATEFIDKNIEQTLKEKEEEKKISEKIEIDEDDDESDVMKLKVSRDKVSDEKQKAEKLIEEGIFTVDPYFAQPSLLPEEKEADADKFKLAYKESSRNEWIEKFMKNNEYGIIDNEGQGDCLFAVIRDAFAHIGHKTTVQKMRALLATQLTEDVFLEQRTLYNDFESQIQDIEKDIKNIKKTNQIYAQRIKKIENKEERDKIVNDTKLLKETYDTKMKEMKETRKLQELYVGYMREIDTLEKYREYIQTSNFWADSWAISTLEVLLKIKLIIFSEESYNSKSYDNVMNCGEINKALLESKQFEPKFYIMTSYTGNHYKLITYKRKHIFTFKEIPYDVKILIVNKCLEKNAGSYYIIQEFRNFKTMLGLDADEGNPDVDLEEDLDDSNSNLYNNNTIFVYHSKSLDAKPGEGSAEKIDKSRKSEFSGLVKIKNWRRKLDDSWNESPFNVDGHRWASVEHYIQGAKFKKGFPDFYKQFSLDIPSELSKDPDLAKNVGDVSKTKHKDMRPVKVKIDVDYNLGRNLEERELALHSKFTQNEDLKQLLLMTKDAQLKQSLRRKPATTDMLMMKIRNQLR